jgi:riboflavin kinase/FMN adenylyltransferase
MKTALTIGFFDGVHIGHQALLKRLRQCPHTTILTFSNHPAEAFGKIPPPLLIPFEEKISLLRPYADELIVLPFTREFARTPYEEFLAQFDLSHLILGQGDAFGKNREGTEEKLRSKPRNFQIEYIPKVTLDGEKVSSSRIRQAIAENKHELIYQLLGRAYV